MRSSVSAVSAVALMSAASGVMGQQTGWGQCGGMNWAGPFTCINGWTCTFSNNWYSQCLPGVSTSGGVVTTTSSASPTPISSTTTTTLRTSTTTTRASTTISTTSIRTSSTTTTTQRISTTPVTTSPSRTPTTPVLTTTTSRTTTPVVTGTYPGPTLLPNYLWIRAVTTPHFHEYLQSPSSTAIIASHLTAGQFNIVSGQLVQTTSAGLLYANVEQRSDATDMLLGMKFLSTPNAFGTFAWSGDALQWTVASITRPNPSAWYVCGTGNELFINLGQYLYGTPAGCSDHTIHFYNGATADL